MGDDRKDKFQNNLDDFWNIDNLIPLLKKTSYNMINSDGKQRMINSKSDTSTTEITSEASIIKNDTESILNKSEKIFINPLDKG